MRTELEMEWYKARKYAKSLDKSKSIPKGFAYLGSALIRNGEGYLVFHYYKNGIGRFYYKVDEADSKMDAEIAVVREEYGCKTNAGITWSRQNDPRRY